MEITNNPQPKKRHIKVMLILILTIIIGITVYMIYNISRPNIKPSKTSESPIQQSTTGHQEIDKMLKNIKYEKIDETKAGICSDTRNVCYMGETVLIKIDYPVQDKFKKIVANLDENNWHLDDGTRVSRLMNPELMALIDEDSGNSNISNPSYIKPNKNYGIFSFLNLGLFGEYATLYRGNEGAYFIAFSEELVQTNEQPYYILDSEVPGAHDFDFGEILSKVDENSFVLSVTYGKEYSDNE